MTGKPRLLILSHVLPFPRRSGQQQRVYYTLVAARRRFHTTFLTAVETRQVCSTRQKLLDLCDEATVLPSKYARTPWSRVWHRLKGMLYLLRTGLKFSNYVVGRVEFSPWQVAQAIGAAHFDCVLYEYWHAVDSTVEFRKRAIPCVLDMHDILWQSYARQLAASPPLLAGWKRWAVEQYRAREEAAWSCFDALVAVNAQEGRIVSQIVGPAVPVFDVPMGVDLDKWPYSWEPAQPPRIAYYGGLGSSHNQQDALRCYEQIMPLIWQEVPEAELWLVGSEPSANLWRIAAGDRRVTVTGFVEHVQSVLCTMTVLLCPWQGTYGFRSRLVEAMALGVPVAATPDAVYGMGMEAGQGLLLGATDADLAGACLALIRDPDLAREHSRMARMQVEAKFGFEATYGKLAEELLAFTLRWQAERPSSL